MAYQRFLETGQIVSTHGIKGEVRIQPWCDDSAFLTEFDSFYLDKQGKNSIMVESARVHKNVVVAKLQGIDTMEQAQKMRNCILYIDREELELPEDTYFIQDLIGLTVKNIDTGKVYGKLTQVSQPGANDVYHITDDQKKERLIPAIPDVVIRTDLKDSIMEIRPLKGLFEDED